MIASYDQSYNDFETLAVPKSSLFFLNVYYFVNFHKTFLLEVSGVGFGVPNDLELSNWDQVQAHFVPYFTAL